MCTLSHNAEVKQHADKNTQASNCQMEVEEEISSSLTTKLGVHMCTLVSLPQLTFSSVRCFLCGVNHPYILSVSYGLKLNCSILLFQHNYIIILYFNIFHILIFVFIFYSGWIILPRIQRKTTEQHFKGLANSR